LLSLGLTLVTLLNGCSGAAEQIVLSGPTMGTTYTVKIPRSSSTPAARTIRIAIESELELIDRSMSGYRNDSEISKFNAARSTEWFEVSEELAFVIATALEVSELSNGAFDITVAPLVRLWGFGPYSDVPIQLPSLGALAAASERVGYRKLQARTHPAALRKDTPDLHVDLNGIAPGFAVDRIARHFEAMGIEDYMIEIGGEVRVRGRNAENGAWRIAVERPEDSKAVPFAILQLDDMSVTTSGEYRHYYDLQGSRYSHTIDPRTGRPVAHELASVVVLHPESIYTDAWATAFNVLGAEAGHALAMRRAMPVLFIHKKSGRFVATMTPAFEKYVAVGP
jgi:thiamine biosynthesis lipoprotein